MKYKILKKGNKYAVKVLFKWGGVIKSSYKTVYGFNSYEEAEVAAIKHISE